MGKKRGNHVTAADIMQENVVFIGHSDSMREAMNLMMEHRVSGLPVLSGTDKCVGVVSARDILEFEQEQAESDGEAEDDVEPYFDPLRDRWETIRVVGHVDSLPDVPVEDVMTRDLVSVEPKTPIKQVAQVMLEHDVHRILVLDDHQYLHGLISSFDFVRLFAET